MNHDNYKILLEGLTFDLKGHIAWYLAGRKGFNWLVGGASVIAQAHGDMAIEALERALETVKDLTSEETGRLRQIVKQTLDVCDAQENYEGPHEIKLQN